MTRSARAVRQCLLSIGLALLVLLPVSAYEGETPGSPDNDDNVSANFEFFIEADGSRETEVYYRIEVAEDDEFEFVLARFDSRDNNKGWIYGDLMGVDEVPDIYQPVSYEGIRFRVRGRLKNGRYFWRASRAQGSGAWIVLDGVASFRVDTIPPEPVDTLRIRLNDSGQMQLHWDPVFYDENSDEEEVSGYRVYRYTRLLKRYPVMTRYLISEDEQPESVIPGEASDGAKIVFYRVRAVDRVGNEEGRRRPAPMGSLANQLNPPNLDQMVNQDWLRQQSRDSGL